MFRGEKMQIVLQQITGIFGEWCNLILYKKLFFPSGKFKGLQLYWGSDIPLGLFSAWTAQITNNQRYNNSNVIKCQTK